MRAVSEWLEPQTLVNLSLLSAAKPHERSISSVLVEFSSVLIPPKINDSESPLAPHHLHCLFLLIALLSEVLLARQSFIYFELGPLRKTSDEFT